MAKSREFFCPLRQVQVSGNTVEIQGSQGPSATIFSLLTVENYSVHIPKLQNFAVFSFLSNR
jgi:hypothetical protein